MAIKDVQFTQVITKFISLPEDASGQAKAVTVKVNPETVNAVDALSCRIKKTEVICLIGKMASVFKAEHVGLLIEFANLDEDLFLLDDFEPYTKAFQGDKVAQEFIPILMMVGFGGTKSFKREFQKVQAKKLSSQRKTYWMMGESLTAFKNVKELFKDHDVNLTKSQVFELMVKMYYRISGVASEVDRSALHGLALMIDELMESLSGCLEETSRKISILRNDYPEHFEDVSLEEDELTEFCEDSGLGAAIHNFYALRKRFEEYVRSNSQGGAKAFADDCNDENGGPK